MQRRIPSAGTPLQASDLFTAFRGLWQPYSPVFQDILKTRLGKPYISLVNSGTTACYIILKVLAGRSSRREVVLPAYTAPSLTLPIRKAGLIPRLCEISLDTFNLDPSHLEQAVGPNTLCVMPVHMFGLPCDMDAVRQAIAGQPVYMVEDAASSFGSKLNQQETGALSEVGFFSFNRGKNLSTLSGGSIVTDDAELFDRIEAERRALPELSRKAQYALFLKLVGLAAAVRPLGYTALYPWVKRYKYTALHTDFVSYQYPGVLAGAGVNLMGRADALFDVRRRHGLFLMEALKDIRGIRLPAILPGACPVFNQFPVLVEDPDHRTRLIDEIMRRTGVEATMLYPDPLHRIYEMGYPRAPDPFPNATFMSCHLLLIPSHPLMTRNTLTRIVEIFQTTRPAF